MQCSCLSLVPQMEAVLSSQDQRKRGPDIAFFSRDKKVLSSSMHHCKYSHKMTNLKIHQKLTCKLQTLNHISFCLTFYHPNFFTLQT